MWIYCAVLVVSWELVLAVENETIYMYKAESPPKIKGKQPFIINIPDSYPEESTVEEFPWRGMIVQPPPKSEETSNEVEIFKSIELDFKDNSDFSEENITGGESSNNHLKTIRNEAHVNTVVTENPYKSIQDIPLLSQETFIPTPPADESYSIPCRKEIVQRSAPEEFSNNFDFESRLLLGRALLRKEDNNARTASYKRRASFHDRNGDYSQQEENYPTTKTALRNNISNEGRNAQIGHNDEAVGTDDRSGQNIQPQENYSNSESYQINKVHNLTENPRVSPRSKARNLTNNNGISSRGNIKAEIRVKSQPIYIITETEEHPNFNNAWTDKRQNDYDLHDNILIKRRRKERPTVSHWDFGRKTQNSTQRNVIRQDTKVSINIPEAQKSTKHFTYSNAETVQDVRRYPQQRVRQRSEEIPVSALNPLIHHRAILRSYEESQVPPPSGIPAHPWIGPSAATPQQETQVVLIHPYGPGQSQSEVPVLNSPEHWQPLYLQEGFVAPYPILFQANGQPASNIVPLTLQHIPDPRVQVPGSYVLDGKRKEPVTISEIRHK